MKEKIMLKFLKNLFGIGPYSESRPADVVAPGGAPYKVPEPAATPIPMVPETKVAHDMGGSYIVEETIPEPNAVAKPKAPKAAKPAAAKAPAKPKVEKAPAKAKVPAAAKKPKISIAK
jgi:hypothetical protein